MSLVRETGSSILLAEPLRAQRSKLSTSLRIDRCAQGFARARRSRELAALEIAAAARLAHNAGHEDGGRNEVRDATARRRVAACIIEAAQAVARDDREGAGMSELIIWTLDWVPEGPRGFVRDLRLRWACEEAGVAYSVRTVPFDGRETNHLSQQPFGQVPFLSDGDVETFESGAGLLHLARKSEKLMPRDPVGEAEVIQWMTAALNSIEMVTVPWWYLEVTGAKDNGLAGWMGNRLGQLEKVLSEREWL